MCILWLNHKINNMYKNDIANNAISINLSTGIAIQKIATAWVYEAKYGCMDNIRESIYYFIEQCMILLT